MSSYQPSVNPLTIAIRVGAPRSGMTDASTVVPSAALQVRPRGRRRREARAMVVVQDGHGLDARRQHQPGSRSEQRGVVPPLRSAHQVAGGRRDAARPHCRGGQQRGRPIRRWTGREGRPRPPRTLRRPSVPPPAPSARSASACSRLPLMMFTHVPLLLRSDATDAVRHLTGPSVMSFRRSVESLVPWSRRPCPAPRWSPLKVARPRARRTRVVPGRYPGLRSRPPQVLGRPVLVGSSPRSPASGWKS